MEQRLIDANALKTEFNLNFGGVSHAVAAGRIIDAAPTIDPVKHGRWIYNKDDFTPKKRCSHCGYNKPVAAGDRLTQEPENYCPNCGAKMNGGTT